MEHNESINLFNLIQPEDFSINSTDQHFRIVAFSTMSSNPTKEFLHKKLGNAHLILAYTSLPYYSPTTSQIISTDTGLKININNCDDKPKRTPEGFWLILVIPYDSLSKSVDFIEAELVGFISVYFGTSYAYEVFFRNDYQFHDKRLMMFDKVINAPAIITRVGLTSGTINFFNSLINKFNSCDDLKKEIVLSCLRWYRKSVGVLGVEGFIFLWTALEVIGKDGTQKLRILKAKMVDLYNIPEKEIENTFYIGHIESFRGRILHNGFDYPISGIILEYLRFLIEDLVLSFLIGTKTKRALNYVNDNRIEIIKAVNR